MEEKRKKESQMEEADLEEVVGGDLQLDFMEGAVGDESSMSETVDKGANGDVVADKSEKMESEGMTM